MQFGIDGVRRLLEVPRSAHLNNWYDDGYQDCQWGCIQRDIGPPTAAHHLAYQQGWHDAAQDGLANRYCSPPPSSAAPKHIPRPSHIWQHPPEITTEC